VKVRELLRDLREDGRKIIKWILKKYGRRV
jgi:hypothetical protein